MEIVIALVLAYLMSGISLVITDLGAPPLDRPGWALNPTLGSIIINALIWFIRPFTDQYFMFGQLSRAIAFGLLNLLAEFAGLFFVFWWLLNFLPAAIGSTVLVIVAIAVIFIVGLFILPPLITLVVLPITGILSIPLNLIFPIKGNGVSEE